ncbi:MAG: PilC/PilY family type IV pilus protein, partial [Chitinispirillaceae bacterium]|nr:PilC/PilY family type IV pilus protein [Chitinispirillaceae bacterium]
MCIRDRTATGDNLGTSPGTIIIETTGTNPVTVASISATPNASGTEVKFTIPGTVSIGNYNIKWRSSDGYLSNGLLFEVLAVTSDPIIDSIYPASGAAGDVITIFGRNFGNYVIGNKVLFGAIEADIISGEWQNSQIKVKVPNLSSGNVLVQVIKKEATSLLESNKVNFTVLAPGTAGPFNVRVYYPYNPWGVIQELYMENYNTNNPTWKTNVPIPGFLNHNGVIAQGANKACMNNFSLSPKDFIKAVRESTLTTSSPLYTTLDKAIKYFKGESSTLSAFGCQDPLLNSSWCKKNFILYVGSGKMDDNYTQSQLKELVRVPHTNDIRPAIQNIQNITFYAVSVSGVDDFRQNLKVIADYGGFTDKNSNQIPENGEYNSKKRPNRNTSFEPDSRYKPYIPDTYFEPGGSTYDLATQIKEAISDILQRATSGTAVSVLATSAEGEGALFQAFFRPIHFEPDYSVSWLGYLQGLFIDPFGNIRADSDGNKKLHLTVDDIVTLSYDSATGDTIAELYKDVNGDGKPDTTIPYKKVPLAELPTLWEAGKILAETHPDDRKIFTTINGTESGRVDFKPANAGTLQNLLRAPSVDLAQDYINFVRGEDLSTKGYRDRRVTVSGSLRVWKLADIVYSTPTVVSAPSENYDLIYGDKSYFNFYNNYKNRKAVIYVGSNDGLLHAFSAGKFIQGNDGTGTTGYFEGTDMGKELWAFIPRSFLPHIQWQTNKNYQHVFGIDLKVKVVDVQITKGGVKQWATVLIGGMRLGGGPISAGGQTINPAYFALDITDPDN